MEECLPGMQEALGLILSTTHLGLAASKARGPLFRFMNLNQPVFSFMKNVLLVENRFLYQSGFQELRKKQPRPHHGGLRSVLTLDSVITKSLMFSEGPELLPLEKLLEHRKYTVHT